MGPSLPEEFEEQAQAVKEYGQWPESVFRTAARDWIELASKLMAQDLGRMGERANANIVRAVALPSGLEGVLKVSITDAFHEASLLKRYPFEDGFAVKVIDDGVTQGGRPWILTLKEAGAEPSDPLDREVIVSAARVASRARQAAGLDMPDNGRAWPNAQAELSLKIKDSQGLICSLLEETPGPSTESLLHVLFQYLSQGSLTLSHGDWRSRNSLLTPEGRLVLLDPTGMLGPAETDMSTWIAIAAAKQDRDPIAPVTVAAQSDPDLDFHTLLAWSVARILLLAAHESTTNFLRRDPRAIVISCHDAIRILTNRA